ncbi:hypothetical protein IEQ34_003411 [Dendrobium chrysotoxum]|uniref:DUF4283 domain-containing protein n=1 Tax=Dendrobium chrysotoxum TaxID=161865 RepID=A0AAV7HLK5_DENCH|nr:hypothetical protein IEQ34_003411 [Dendrobium chrysotoxum]
MFFNLKFSSKFYVTLLNHRHLIKWTLLFDLSKESPVVPIWIFFPELWPYLFSGRILFGLGSLFVHPLQTDNANASRSRLSVTHILGDLDITKKYPNKVWLGSYIKVWLCSKSSYV